MSLFWDTSKENNRNYQLKNSGYFLKGEREGVYLYQTWEEHLSLMIKTLLSSKEIIIVPLL